MTGIRVSGPLWDGRADRAVQDFLDDPAARSPNRRTPT